MIYNGINSYIRWTAKDGKVKETIVPFTGEWVGIAENDGKLYIEGKEQEGKNVE